MAENLANNATTAEVDRLLREGRTHSYIFHKIHAPQILIRARANRLGKTEKRGRPRQVTDEQLEQIRGMVEQHKSVRQISDAVGLSPQVVRYYRDFGRFGEESLEKTPNAKDKMMDSKVLTLAKERVDKLDPKVKRAIFNALDEHFDTETGSYRVGFSDQVIGNTMNLPFAVVASIREEFFGEIRTDPMIEETQASLITLRQSLETLKSVDLTEIKTWQAEAVTLIKNFEDKMKGMESELSRCDEMIRKMRQRLGMS